jgi:hypothetical protein
MTIRYIAQRLFSHLLPKQEAIQESNTGEAGDENWFEDCLINNVNFSTEPYLIEIGDHVAIAAGTDFITHDGAIWCFREELQNADVFGKIK